MPAEAPGNTEPIRRDPAIVSEALAAYRDREKKKR
jgi:hypothetical protein